MMQKAMELVGEVRGLGNTLLSAMEKREGERLGMLRQGHEIKIQKAMQEVRYLQWGAAQNATEALLRGRDSVLERYKYYLRLQGGAPDADTTPETFEADRRELTEENFGDVYTALVGQYEKAIVLQDYAALKLHDEGSLKLHVGEHEELNKYAADAALARMLAAGVEGLTSALAAIPNINAKVALWGVGGESELTGGAFLANIGRAVSAGFNLMATGADRKGQSVLKTASYELRAHDRILQANLAAHELMQIGRQIISSLIAEQIARHEYESIKAQIRSAQEVATFLETKFTNEELYGWMQGELSRVYYEYYRFAIDTARKAERTMKQELMRPEVDATSFIQFNYWDAGRKGLLSGDALHLDLKRMEMAYHDNNKRELEITRHVSLRQLDPLALLRLKVDGTCEVEIPEWFYDLDCPGHYMRRIKTVSLSLPAVAGAYTSVSCTLTLLRSTIRKSPLPKEGAYARVDNDDRFIDYFGASQSIVTSTGTNDGGLFETNLHDERFLPFEGAGAISRWRLTLPKKLRQFDYDTITDAILHVRYTARQGGETLGGMATEAVKAAFELKSSPPLLFSLRHDFPTEWASYARGTANLTVRLRREHFPYWVQGEALLIERIELYSGEALTRTSIEAPDPTAPFGEFADVVVSTGSLARDSEANVFMVVSYSLEPSA
jgi:hypothetical protein